MELDPLTRAAEEVSRPGDQVEEMQRLPSLSDRLFSATADLLFCAGFTIPEAARGTDGDADKINVS